MRESQRLERQRQRWSRLGAILSIASVMLAANFLLACDPEGRKQCAWVLEPEPNLKGTTDPGYIPVCARNRKTEKQDCRLQAKLDFAEKVYGRTFRYVDLQVESPGIPRTVSSIKFCDGK